MTKEKFQQAREIEKQKEDLELFSEGYLSKTGALLRMTISEETERLINMHQQEVRAEIARQSLLLDHQFNEL